jgi:EAL domain-containing protein (putative c-di-GMP-specific phosphodiesterase class I)/GGDEF domain-containing protein
MNVARNADQSVRFAEALRRFQDRSERLVGWIQLAVIAVFGALYFASPTAGDAGHSAINAVPVALALYGIFTIIKQILAYRQSLPGWLISLSILVDMCLLFALIWSFHLQYNQPPAFYLKAPTLLYVFIFIALRALRLEMFYVLLAGGLAVIGWLGLAGYAAIGTPDLLGATTRDYVVYMTSPRILWGAEIDKIIAIVMVTSILAISVSRGRGLLLRERDASIELEDKQVEVSYLAYKDPLTGLPNLAGLIEMTKGAEEPHGVLVVELDDLRKRMAVLGKGFTDDLVAVVLHRMQERLPQNYLVARVAETEFAIIVPGQSLFHELKPLALALLATLDEPVVSAGRSVIQTARAGLAIWNPAKISILEGIQNAQIAALRSGLPSAPRAMMFDDKMREEEIAFGELEIELRGAIASGDAFVPHYQPIFDMKRGALVGFEALARWQHPERGLIPPFKFIPVAEATGLIVPLGRQILKTACRDLIRFDPSAGSGGEGAGLFMSVNLSARQLTDNRLLHRVGRALARTGVRPDRIKLELTESEATGALEQTRERLVELKKMGLSLSIDDFGTGYSSLSYLHGLPFDVLKIDRSFVIDVSTSEQSRAVIDTIVNLARSFGLETVAEGIEDEETLGHLRTLGVGMAQGYHTGRPVPFEEAVRFVR